MVVIRLSRGGAKKRPFYHVVVTDKRSPRDGRCIERVGYFNPIAAGKEVRLHLATERLQYWISQGAQPSERVQSLMKSQKNKAASPSEAISKAKSDNKSADSADGSSQTVE